MIHVTANSKEVKPGSIFFAIKGAKFDGHDFIDDAIQAGASQIFAERDVGKFGVTVLGKDTRKKLGELASEMYGHPTRKLVMIGVTGTSGKTTTSYLIEHLLNSAGQGKENYRCARMGTNGASFKGKTSDTSNTTPDALSLQKWFREVLDDGATHVVMEVSSHALDQERVSGIAWDAAVFLNLSPEHMDYHPTLEHYFETKARLFTDHAWYSKTLGKHPVLYTNLDTPYGKKLLALNSEISGFSVKNQFHKVQNTPTGLSANFKLGRLSYVLHCPLFGDFQLENILAAVSVCVGLGVKPEKIIPALATFGGVPGRMEHIANDRGIYVFVDYAHKPEALEKVLKAIQGKRIITVFGCGGDRDKTKRPVMGAIAAKLSNELILTSDNPRTEDPLVILDEIEAGVKETINQGLEKIVDYDVIPDRAAAIQKAIEIAKENEIVLIAGKGHEDYQIFGTEKRHFDDREEARKALTGK
jgi:UDP-N-acetylmuramoyl-L-alanyl-D-glutamate--2,6-diaminopimelate ligase